MLISAAQSFRRLGANGSGFLEPSKLVALIGKRAESGLSFRAYYGRVAEYPGLLSHDTADVASALVTMLRDDAAKQIKTTARLEGEQALDYLQRAFTFLVADRDVSVAALKADTDFTTAIAEKAGATLLSKPGGVADQLWAVGAREQAIAALTAAVAFLEKAGSQKGPKRAAAKLDRYRSCVENGDDCPEDRFQFSAIEARIKCIKDSMQDEKGQVPRNEAKKIGSAKRRNNEAMRTTLVVRDCTNNHTNNVFDR